MGDFSQECEMSLRVALALSLIAAASALPFVAQQPCCQGKCQTAGQEKYWSIAKSILGTKHCGECCMDPKEYKLYHLFEKNLTKSAVDSPCKSFGFTKYDSTVTHGFGPVKMTLDLYDKSSTEVVPNGPPNGLFCGKVPFIISMNMTVNAAAMTFDYNNDVKVTGLKVSCSGEKFKYDGTNFDISGVLADPTDCLAKAISKDAKSKPTLSFDGTNIVAKNGYGTLKLKPKLSPGATCD